MEGAAANLLFWCVLTEAVCTWMWKRQQRALPHGSAPRGDGQLLRSWVGSNTTVQSLNSGWVMGEVKSVFLPLGSLSFKK